MHLDLGLAQMLHLHPAIDRTGTLSGLRDLVRAELALERPEGGLILVRERLEVVFDEAEDRGVEGAVDRLVGDVATLEGGLGRRTTTLERDRESGARVVDCSSGSRVVVVSCRASDVMVLESRRDGGGVKEYCLEKDEEDDGAMHGCC